MADSVAAGIAGRIVRRRGDRARTRSASVVLLVPAVILALFMTASYWSLSPGFNNNPYLPALATEGNYGMLLIGPYVAVCAAWEARTLRVMWSRLTIRRRRVDVLAGRLGLVVGCGLVAMLIVYVARAGSGTFRALLVWQLSLITLISILVWTIFGAALALLLRPLIAFPLALLVPFFARVLPPAWSSPSWARYLTGQVTECCSPSQIPSTKVFLASGGALLALGACCCAIIAVRLARTRLELRRSSVGGIAVAVVAVLVAVSAAISVRHLGFDPQPARSVSDLSCSGDLCLWPEDEPARAANEKGWHQVREVWTKQLGLPLHSDRAGPVNTSSIVGVATSTKQSRLAAGSMAGLLPHALAGCIGGTRSSDRASEATMDRLGVLLQRRIGQGGQAPKLPPGTKALSVAGASAAWASVKHCR